MEYARVEILLFLTLYRLFFYPVMHKSSATYDIHSRQKIINIASDRYKNIDQELNGEYKAKTISLKKFRSEYTQYCIRLNEALYSFIFLCIVKHQIFFYIKDIFLAQKLNINSII